MRLKARIVAVFLVATTLSWTAPANAVPGARIRMAKIFYDSSGPDTGSNNSINNEYVILKNVSTVRGNLAGYTIRDQEGHARTFGTRYLDPGQVVYLRSGKGTNTATTIYWGSDQYIWNNHGDTAYWSSPSGTLLQTCKWVRLTGLEVCAGTSKTTTRTPAAVPG